MPDPIRELRVDAHALDVGAVRDDGHVHLKAIIAKPGIMLYEQGGRKVRELVPREVLQDAEQMQLSNGSPATVDHPEDNDKRHVTPENAQRVSVGTGLDVAWDEEVDGQTCRYKFWSEKGTKALSQGKVFNSPAYDALIDKTPGVDPEFGPYDQRQVKRFPYNSFAITALPRGGQELKTMLEGRADSAHMIIASRADSGDTPAGGDAMGRVAAAIEAQTATMQALIEEVKGMRADMGVKPKADEDEENPGEGGEMMPKADAVNPFLERAEIEAVAERMGVELAPDLSNVEAMRAVAEVKFATLSRADATRDAGHIRDCYKLVEKESRTDSSKKAWGKATKARKTSGDKKTGRIKASELMG